MEIVGRELGHVEHLVDERLRRRNPDDILARLADARFELLGGLFLLLSGRRLSKRRGGEQNRKEYESGLTEHLDCMHVADS